MPVRACAPHSDALVPPHTGGPLPVSLPAALPATGAVAHPREDRFPPREDHSKFPPLFCPP